MDQKMRDYIHPFRTLEHFLLAIQISKRLFIPAKNNFQQIQNCINQLCQTQLNIFDITNFVTRINFYPHEYPLNFIKDFEKLNIAIDNHASINKESAISLDVKVSRCLFCQNDGPKWFQNVAQKLAKKANLFCIDKASKWFLNWPITKQVYKYYLLSKVHNQYQTMCQM
jgi:hypothetical protein